MVREARLLLNCANTDTVQQFQMIIVLGDIAPASGDITNCIVANAELHKFYTVCKVSLLYRILPLLTIISRDIERVLCYLLYRVFVTEF